LQAVVAAILFEYRDVFRITRRWLGSDLEETRLQLELARQVELERAEKTMFWVTVLMIGAVFGTVLVFYFIGGIEHAKTAWMFCGPLMGSLAGYWFSRR
jgi:hypothetical protein